ncbi:MAG: patatin-like phospholipase family protein [Gemmatimonadetes bacterium]|nr:patatin-like phospholipase family protein [Gemmatimonadota bacterium]
MHRPADIPPRVALVLGGGGLKGCAHIGVLRALEERGIRPSVIAGSSIGALIAAAYVRGLSVDDIEATALALRKNHLFRIDHVGMVMRRMLAPALYLEAPLRALVDRLAPEGTFDDLPMPLLVNTTDIERGTQVTWGLPGLRDVPVADAVYASCALPGFFPPRIIRDRVCVDGGVLGNTPAHVAALGADAIIAVDVGSTSSTTARRVREKGFATVFMRSVQLMMRSQQQMQLSTWQGPPLLLIRPPIWRLNWFSFAQTRAMIHAGYQAACDVLDHAGDALISPPGVYPRRRVEVVVDRARCTGCGLCVALAPSVMRLTSDGKAEPVDGTLEWSRADGAFVPECPEHAISVDTIDPDGGRRRTMEHQVFPD